MDVRSVNNSVPIDLAEAGRGAELPHLGLDQAVVKRELDKGWIFLEVNIQVKRVFLEFNVPARADVVRIQIFPRKRPTTARYPRTYLEILRIERRRPPGPVPGRAAKEMQPSRLKWEIRMPDRRARVEVLNIRLYIKAAALEQDDLVRLKFVEF